MPPSSSGAGTAGRRARPISRPDICGNTPSKSVPRWAGRSRTRAAPRRSGPMRISDRLIPAALFTVGLGLVSAFGFEGTGTRDGMAPAAAVDTVPRSAAPASALVPPMAIPNVSGGPTGSANAALPAARPVTRSLTPTHPLTPGEAFLSGTQALRAGDTKAGIHALEYAAENGHALAEWKLGRMYADGDQVGR